MAEHELKCWPVGFDAVRRGEKTHEFRKDDRGFEVGDTLLLRRWVPKLDPYAPDEHCPGEYTGEELTVRVAFISRGGGCHGLPRGYCVMSIAPESAE
jgi:hypothetical protein